MGRLLKKQLFDTNDVFVSSVYITQFLEDDLISRPTAAAMISFYEGIWPEIIQKRAFSMRSPATNGPYILEALRKGDTPLQRLANVVLASEVAAKRNLPDDLRQRITRIATKRIKSVARDMIDARLGQRPMTVEATDHGLAGVREVRATHLA